MEFIRWTEAARVGVPVIDEQHRQLVDLINRLYDALRLRQPLPTLRPYLDELAEFADTHFATEEQLMRQYGLPEDEVSSHEREHGNFRECLGELKRDLDAGAVSLRLDLWQFVAKWWDNHGMGADRELARAINAD